MVKVTDHGSEPAMTGNLELFPESDTSARAAVSIVPLAEQLRPACWQEFEGLEELDRDIVSKIKAGVGKPLSLVLWGPAGCGKTTFAKLYGRSFDCNFVEFSAVLGGVKEVREIVEVAKLSKRPTVLFVDEIHRFNKAQQDAFLPHVERGAVVLLGATTENPSFYLTSALLSRMMVLVLKPIEVQGLRKILARASAAREVALTTEAQELLCGCVGGDARKLIALLERIDDVPRDKTAPISVESLRQILGDSKVPVYDRAGEEHYNTISAFIKSLRGSDPDAALFWCFRMLESGDDPRFLLRRMIIFASEDIGNADPRALPLAVAAAEAYDRIGLPEGRIPLAQCVTYLASAPKSNRSYVAMNRALASVKEHKRVTVPIHLRNAPTGLMQGLGYGSDYQYPHDSEHGFVPGVNYLPEEAAGASFYEPSEHGFEKKILERMRYLKGI